MKFSSRRNPARYRERIQLKKLLLVMKLTILLMVIALVQASAKGFGQKVTLHKKNASFENIMKEIKKQTGYTAFYDESVKAVPITVDVNNASVKETLDQCFQNLPITYKIVDSNIFFQSKEEKQGVDKIITPASVPVVVTGLVTDENKNPLPGVTVLNKKGNRVVATDEHGHYSISTEKGDVLLFRIIGYKTKEVPIDGQTVINVSLEQITAKLDQVVVTALGIKKSREMVSYSTQEVKGTDLQTAPETNVASNLVGKVAGLSVATKSTLFESPDVELRGAQALVVLDGVPTDKHSFDFWSVDPNNIESVTVLKGTAAAALYGSDGINGAIMITTKTGKDGANGTEVTFNSTNQFQAGFLRLPKTQTQYGMGWNGYYAFINGNGGGGWEDNYGYVWGPKLNQKDPSTPSGYVEVPQYNSPYDPNQLYSFTQAGYTDQSHYKPIPFITRGSNNLANFLNEEFTTTNNISVAGKTDKTDFRISLTDVYQRGQVPNTSLNSTTLSLSGSVNVSDKLKIQGLLSYNYQNSPNYPSGATSGTSGGAGPADYFYDILLWMGPDVDIRNLRNYWQPGGANPRPNSFAYGTQNFQQFNYNYSWYNNPYFVAYENLNSYTNHVINTQLNANYIFNKNLSLMVRSAVSTNNSYSDSKVPYSFIDNSFSMQPKGGYSMSQNNNLQIISDVLLTYKKDFLKDFHATVSVGGTTRYNRATGLSQNTVGGLTVPNYYNLAASAGGPAVAYNALAEKQSSGVLGYADVDYKSMVYLGVTARNDWVSNLPKPNNSFFYPSANAGIVFSNIFHLPEPISYFKLRASWAQVSDNSISISGNIYSDWYASLATYNNGTRWNNNPSLSLPGTLIATTLKPNTTVSQEYGAEMLFFKSRLGLDLTYFNYDKKNLLNLSPLSTASGYDYYYVNGGNYARKGFEVVAKFAAIRSTNFRWDISANWDEQHTYQGAYYGGSTIQGGIKTGDRTDAIYARTWETDNHGNVVYDSNGNPVATPYNVKLGYSDPKWGFGITNNFRYKQFSLKVSIDGRVGGKIFDGVQAQLYDAGNEVAEVNSYRDDAYLGKATYQPAGVVVTNGSISYSPLDGHVISDNRTFSPSTTKVNYIDWVRNYYRGGSGAYGAELYSRSFVKLREVILSYNFNPVFLKKVSIKTATVSLTGRNLFLWTKVPYLDPDGYNGFALPEPSYRNIGVNLNLKF